jgi:hypothetical protein
MKKDDQSSQNSVRYENLLKKYSEIQVVSVLSNLKSSPRDWIWLYLGRWPGKSNDPSASNLLGGFALPLGEDGRIVTVFSSWDYTPMENDSASVIVRDQDDAMDSSRALSIRKQGNWRRTVHCQKSELEPKKIKVHTNAFDDKD